jgi:hypothetical protein
MTPLADRPTPITDEAAFVLSGHRLKTYVDHDTCRRLEQALAATVDALNDLLEQIDLLEDYKLSRDLPPGEAQINWDGATQYAYKTLVAVAAHVKGE